MLQLKFADSPASMMVWRVRCTGPEYPSVGSAAPGAGTSGMFCNVTTFMTVSLPYRQVSGCSSGIAPLEQHAGSTMKLFSRRHREIERAGVARDDVEQCPHRHRVLQSTCG